MKHLLIIVFTILTISVECQIKHDNDIYKTDIGKANNIEIKNGITTINNANKVLVQIYADVKSRLFLTGYNQVKDSSGFYITTINLINPYSETIELDLDFIFDNPVLDINAAIGVGQLTEQYNNKSNNGYKHWAIIGTVHSMVHGGYIAIKSEEKISFTLKGVEGVLEN